MIKSVNIINFNGIKGVTVRYENGKVSNYSVSKLPKTAAAFIADPSTKAIRSEIGTLYTKEI